MELFHKLNKAAEGNLVIEPITHLIQFPNKQIILVLQLLMQPNKIEYVHREKLFFKYYIWIEKLNKFSKFPTKELPNLVF